MEMGEGGRDGGRKAEIRGGGREGRRQETAVVVLSFHRGAMAGELLNCFFFVSQHFTSYLNFPMWKVRD